MLNVLVCRALYMFFLLGVRKTGLRCPITHTRSHSRRHIRYTVVSLNRHGSLSPLRNLLLCSFPFRTRSITGRANQAGASTSAGIGQAGASTSAGVGCSPRHSPAAGISADLSQLAVGKRAQIFSTHPLACTFCGRLH